MAAQRLPCPKEILKKYQLISEPKGAEFADVRTIRDSKTGKFYTLKSTPDGNAVRQRIMKLNHPHFISIQEWMVIGNFLHLVLERMEGGDLFHRIKHFGKLSEPVAKFYVYQMNLAVDYLHQKLQVVHGNLKVQNVLLSQCNEDYCVVKLSDYYHRNTDPGRRGSKKWATWASQPPQVQEHGYLWYCSRADVWSLGVIMFQCLSGWMPKEGDCSVLEAMENYRIPDCPRELLTRMFRESIGRRYECDDVLAHEWLQDEEMQMKMQMVIKRFKLQDVRQATQGMAESFMDEYQLQYIMEKRR